VYKVMWNETMIDDEVLTADKKRRRDNSERAAMIVEHCDVASQLSD